MPRHLFGLLIPATLILICNPAHSQSGSDATRYETPPVQSIADVLPADLLQSDLYSVDNAVMSDGYLNYYRIRSDYGDFEASGTLMLRTRIREIEALAELDEVSKTGVFIKAAADAGVGQLRTIKQFATHPIKTVVGIPAGIGRMFSRYHRQASDGLDTAKDFIDGNDDESAQDEDGNAETTSATAAVTGTATVVAESYFGVSSAERNWHRELGTDPYTSNEALKKAVKSVAWADRLGRFGIKSVGIPKIPGVSVISDVNEAVWSQDPYELEDLNRARLLDAGADEALVTAFFAESTLSPSQQTLLIAAIADLDGAERRGDIVTQSLNARGESEARFFVETTVLLAWYHRNESPLAAIGTALTIPVGIREDGGLVVLLAADHIYWNETIAGAVGRQMALQDPGKLRTHELLLTGVVSDRCREELQDIGWEISENLTIIDGSASPEAQNQQ